MFLKELKQQKAANMENLANTFVTKVHLEIEWNESIRILQSLNDTLTWSVGHKTFHLNFANSWFQQRVYPAEPIW